MSFGWLGTFRIGQWKGFRKFVLNERRDVESNIDVINAEIRRIGDIIITYDKVRTTRTTPEGAVTGVEVVTERRLAVYCPRNTSLNKLMKAYVAQGGNPLDISLFLKPDSASLVDDSQDIETEEPSYAMTGLERIYPHDGIVAPETPATFNPAGGTYSGGFLTWGKYPWREIQERIPDGDRNAAIAARVDHARRWCHQAIAEKRNNLEAKIIKLMDLREQLVLERDQILVQAVGGSTTTPSPPPDPDEFHPDFHVTAVVSSIDRVIFEESPTGGVNPNRLSDDRFSYDTILEDKPEDENTDL